MTADILMPRHDVYSEKIPVSVFANQHKACIEVANEIEKIIRHAQSKEKYAVLGLATGSSPKGVYKELVRKHKEEGLSFKNIISFNLDCYYPMRGNDKHSYKTFMQEHFFQHVDIQPGNWHIPDSEVPAELLRFHVEEYEKKIVDAGGLDFLLLGIGSNGHIGFNEPGSHVKSRTRLITLDLTTRMDATAEFGSLANVPKKAITMGVQTILNARKIVLLAWGEHKAQIVKKAVEGPVTEFVPASYLQGHPDTSFFLDEAAAAALVRYKKPWVTETVVWDLAMIKKAVIDLCLTTGKPILKLTDDDYNLNHLSDLLALFKSSYEINIKVFNSLQYTITGWPGGKPDASDIKRPERATPTKKRVLIFSPHPDDDIISMGGTFQRLVDQGHEVHVAYQTSGNIAVADDEALRFIEFASEFNKVFQLADDETKNIYLKAEEFLSSKKNGQKDEEVLRRVKGLIRRSEAKNTCRFVGLPSGNVHFLDLPFYETGLVEKKPLGEEDFSIVEELIVKIQPHQIFAAGDLADPHGTHKTCLEAIFGAIHRVKHYAFMKECWVWLYKGAWAEWDVDLIEMAVPMSPDEVIKKRLGIFKHQSQKDGVVFQGADSREFWQRAEDRNRSTALMYHRLGLAEYEAMEAFVRWRF